MTMLDGFSRCQESAKVLNLSTLHGKIYDFFIGVVLIFIIFVNTLVSYGLYRTNQLRRFSTRLFFALSINDLTGGILAVSSFFVGIFSKSESQCKLWSGMNGLSFLFFGMMQDFTLQCLPSIDWYILDIHGKANEYLPKLEHWYCL